jgi:uncharacterized cupin superfamily protein
MVKQGTVVVIPPTDDRLEFLETSESSGGKHLKIKWTSRPGSLKPASHVHVLQDEHFDIISGHLTYEIEGKRDMLGPGDNMTLPKGKGHRHYNDETHDLVMIQTISPALDSEDIIYRIAQLAQQGKINKKGEPPFLEVMVWVKKYKAKTYLAKIPVGVQNALASVLAPIGRMLGHGE